MRLCIHFERDREREREIERKRARKRKRGRQTRREREREGERKLCTYSGVEECPPSEDWTEPVVDT
jgi:hypothetical protein